jgi:galactokinase
MRICKGGCAKGDNLRNRKATKRLLLFAGLILVTVSFLLIALIFLLRYEWMWGWWRSYQQFLKQLEDRIFSIHRTWMFIGVIMALYIIKTVIPIYTTSVVCCIAGAVLPAKIAIPLNIIGTGVQMTIKYFWGKKWGAGGSWKLIRKSDLLRHIIQTEEGTGSPVVLVTTGLVPLLSYNLKSAIYGSLDFGYWKFITLSLIGTMPRLLSFTIAGRNLYDPLTPGFLIPIVLITFVTGLTCLSANGVWTATEKIVTAIMKRIRKKKLKGSPTMIENTLMRENLTAGRYDDKFALIYKKEDIEAQKQRYLRVSNEFDEIYGAGKKVSVFSAPGRSEIGGNHTDHNHGKVLAAGVDLDAIAVAAITDDNIIRVKSEGYNMDTISLDDLSPRQVETGHSASLIRGICAAFKARGYNIGGFCAATASDVKSGSGLSSSAAFEVLVCTMLNNLYNSGKIDPVEIAVISQYAENKYFGKPCGLMDQMACSVGSFIKIDFKDTDNPLINKVEFDLSSCGHSLVIIDTGADHSDLTDDYAAVREEMEAVAGVFGKKVLRDVDRTEFEANLAKVREKTNDRAILRAKHFYNENERVDRQAQALKDGDFEEFKRLIIESGDSSFMFNQNVYTSKYPTKQAVSLALSICADELKGCGAWRVHGGGFAGTVQAFVPNDKLDSFKEKICSVFGEKACYVLKIRPVGGIMMIGE